MSGNNKKTVPARSNRVGNPPAVADVEKGGGQSQGKPAANPPSARKRAGGKGQGGKQNPKPQQTVAKSTPKKAAQLAPKEQEASQKLRLPQSGVIEVAPMAGPARARPHHWGLLFSFITIVLVPLAVVSFYLWTIAIDQYGSSTGIAVRGEEGAGATDLLGGLTQLTTSSTGQDSDVLNEFIQSQEIVERIDARLDLRAHYAAFWDEDPVFALWPDATTEDLLWYWERIVRISYDQSTGLIEFQVVAFEPDMAQSVAQAIVDESQERINVLNAVARADAMRYAQEDLDVAVSRLKRARDALAQFRTRTQIIDPKTDIDGRLGVLNNLQQRLANALVEHDLLLEQATRESDPRLILARERIQVIRDRIADERLTFASAGSEVGQLTEDYPTLITEFEGLSVDLDVAEETYRAALTALDVARANAVRQSRYLATYIRPTLAESAEYPRRVMLTGLAALFLGLAWGVMALIYYSIRDRS